ncbi:carbohydrate ABC transporter substrate-binding protein, CUT1 family [Ruaniaceae bacterium KH17]|nr:carbohydrate ABC transporter substrate-binding protein, CUT1 family [Ruaniaceae bacterium KH17]
MKRPKLMVALAVATLAAGGLAACAGDDEPDTGSTSGAGSTPSEGSSPEEETERPDSLKVVYRESPFVTAVMESAKASFVAEHPDVDIVFEPINASASDYFTKVALMNQSPSTAPDIIYEDGFNVTADASAGYLAPLDEFVAEWEDWGQFSEVIRQNGTSAVDGSVYAVPLGTDTQAIWYNKEVFAQAGLPADWQPEDWDDVLDAAAAISSAVPDIVPLNVYATKANGEAATLRGMLNLLAGTPGSLQENLFNVEAQQWIGGSQGFEDALTFLQTAHQAGYLPADGDMQDASLESIVVEQWAPSGNVGMFIDGSWIWSRWEESGSAPWPAWSEALGLAKIPTRDGQAPGFATISGGWTIAIGANTPDPELAFDFVKAAASQENGLQYALLAGSIPVRDDVLSDPEYLASNPTAEFFAELLPNTHFRPGLEEYPQVSSLIQEIMESVTVGGQDVSAAAERYATQLERIVGSDAVR